jgi:UDP-2-acetamido-3-amino-2,3-dideoxy-glucuronate N-acetyltransferase
LSGAKIARDCNICANFFIENDAVIGNKATIKNGFSIFNSIYIEDNIFIGLNVTFTNDLYPRSMRDSNKSKKNYPKTTICEGASIEGASTILPGIRIGNHAIIGAGSLVTQDIADNAIVYGESAKARRHLNNI